MRVYVGVYIRNTNGSIASYDSTINLQGWCKTSKNLSNRETNCKLEIPKTGACEIDWCHLYFFVRHSLVALLDAVCARSVGLCTDLLVCVLLCSHVCALLLKRCCSRTLSPPPCFDSTEYFWTWDSDTCKHTKIITLLFLTSHNITRKVRRSLTRTPSIVTIARMAATRITRWRDKLWREGERQENTVKYARVMKEASLRVHTHVQKRKTKWDGRACAIERENERYRA